MTKYIDAQTLKVWLSDGQEIALIDVREHGQFGDGHLFFAVPIAYSIFEMRLTTLVPNYGVRLVLCDGGNGVAERAASHAEAHGYRDVHVLRGGITAWQSAGNTLYSGVNVPSKAFGELVERERRTPHVTADELKAMSAAGENMVVVDGRPFAEFQRASIPGGMCCPNGELALRIDDIAPDPRTTIVVNCAGRTRSIIGAQTLIDLGVPNPVFALQNGTQGWLLAGFTVANGASRRYLETSRPKNIDNRRARARSLAEHRGARFVDWAEVSAWLKDPRRTTYLIDVRTQEEYASTASKAFMHAPGGQLIQATDQWIGIRGARLVVADSELIRAPVVAAWLRQLGHEAYILDGGTNAAGAIDIEERPQTIRLDRLPTIDSSALKRRTTTDAMQIIDLRPSMEYRKGHIEGALWSIRPRLSSTLSIVSPSTIVLVAEQPGIAELAAIDLHEAGISDVRLLESPETSWREAELPIEATPGMPPDVECIDYLFFTHRRLFGDAEDSRKYLAWEIGLTDQLDDQERKEFNVMPAPEP
jgi:rhodanese-related sulfurtransferase